MSDRLAGQLPLELVPATAAPRTGRTAAERGYGPEDFLERRKAGYEENHHSGPGIPWQDRYETVCPSCGDAMTRQPGTAYYCAPCDLWAGPDDLLWREPAAPPAARTGG